MRIDLHLPALLFIGALAACDTPPPEPAVTITHIQPNLNNTNPTTRCFLSVTTSPDGAVVDTVLVQVTLAGDQVFGRMDWLPEMKDRMLGVLEGTMKNDTITARYSYESEGMSNTEEHLLVMGSDHITLLTGEMVERDGMMVLKDRTKVVESMQVPEVPCP